MPATAVIFHPKQNAGPSTPLRSARDDSSISLSGERKAKGEKRGPAASSLSPSWCIAPSPCFPLLSRQACLSAELIPPTPAKYVGPCGFAYRFARRSSGPWDFELLADRADRVLFDFTMTRDAGDLAVLRVEPDAMRASLAIRDAGMLAKVTLQVGQLHA